MTRDWNRQAALALATVALALIALPEIAKAETLAVCGEQSGHAYYPESKYVKKADAGWHDDATTGGRTTLSRNEKGEFDITYADTTGGVYSSVAEGAVVVVSRLTPNDSAFIVAYPGSTVQIYQFNRDDSGKQTMVLLQSKGEPFPKGGAYVANCSALTIK